MIVGRPLTPAEIEDRLAYLDRTPVGASMRSNAHRFFWRQTNLVIPDDLFGLLTLWSAGRGTGEKHSVAEVGRMVGAGIYTDDALQTRILAYVEGIQTGRIDLVITLVEFAGGVVIVDGNARCVALYVLAVERNLAIKEPSVPVVFAASTDPVPGVYQLPPRGSQAS